MYKERTFIAVKPEGIQRRFIGRIIARFEQRGLKLIGAKLVCATPEIVQKHYPDDEEWYISSGNKTYENYKSKGIDPGMTPRELAIRTREKLIDYLSNRPIFVMVWEGPHAVQLGRKTAGATNPLVAESGTIRGDFTAESYELADYMENPIQNLIHASGSIEEARKEINIWFNKNEIIEYEMIDSQLMLGKDWGRVKK